MAGIRFEKVSKYFGEVRAIREVNFEIRDREFMVLVGPSGCGKSTLLRMIAGLETVSKGRLYIDGQVVNDLPPRERDIAIVFQNYALYPHMTAYDNLAFGLKIRKFDKKTIRERVEAAARILDIEPLLNRKPKAMSGGQRQRVAIGRAIVRNPKVFLFDEPLSNLDAKLRGQMRIEIARLHRELQTTMVYVTHDQVEAMTLGDRIVVLNQGEIQQIDTPNQLYLYPGNLFVAGFIGTPPMNFVEGGLTVDRDELHFRSASGTLLVPLASRQDLRAHIGREITLGIRPENILVRPDKAAEAFVACRGEVRFVERLGHESFAFTRVGETQLVTRLRPEETVDPLQVLTLYLDIKKMHFFETETGQVLAAGSH